MVKLSRNSLRVSFRVRAVSYTHLDVYKSQTLRNTPVPDQIRLFHVWTEPTAAPQEDFKNAYSVWVKTDASNIGQYDSFSAVGYIFGRTLYEELQIPIGIIQSCEGDTLSLIHIYPAVPAA